MKMEQLMATKESNDQILGKFLYFGLSNVLIERDTLSEICESISFPVKPGARLSEVDAFKSATGDLYERLVTKEYGEVKISKVYCRDNQSNSNVISRELVKETLGENTNHYKKLANIFFDKETGCFNYSIENYDHEVSVNQHCYRAEELFTLYKRCAGRNQIENMTDSFLNQMEALKISIHGRLFFVPKKSMHMLDILEDFLEALNRNNQRNGQLTVNSMFVIDDAKQRDKMTAEFYYSTKKRLSYI